MERRKIKKRATYAIIGLGRFGLALALELANKGVDLVVIDRDADKIKVMRNYTDNAFIADATDVSTLKRIGIENCDIVVVCLAHQMDASILITLDLVAMGIPRVISKAQSSKHGIILEKEGAEVVYPERDMAIRLANRLVNTQTLDYVRLSEKVNITKVKVTDRSDGHTILNLKIRKKYGCNIIALERNGIVIEDLDPSTKLQNNDIIYVTGAPENLDDLIRHI